MAWQNYNKYKNTKVVVEGIVFQSKREANRYQELSLLERVGAIKNLKRQVKYTLIPSQYEKIWNPQKKAFVRGKCLERECSYVADFVYVDVKSGEVVVEDVKGFRTPEYILKRKMLLYLHDIRIKEI